MRRPRNRTHAVLRVCCLAATVLMPACGQDHPRGAEARGGGGVGAPDVLVGEGERAGEAIFRRENCGRCHTLLERPGPEGTFDLPAGPESDLLASRVGPDLGLEGHRRGDEWHYAHLYAPGVLIRGSRMPASRHLFRPEAGRQVPTRECEDLVAYLQALGRSRRDVWAEWRRREPEIPEPPPFDAALERRGEDLYRRHCEPCHGAGGDGGGELAGFFTFPPRDFVAARYRFRSTPAGREPRDADLYRTITLGTGIGAAMPAYDWLAADDRWALVLAVKRFSPVLRGTGPGAGPAEADTPAVPAGEGRGTPGLDGEVPREGRRLWGDLGCATCHGASGEGLTREEARADWMDAAGVVVPRSGDLTHACALRGGASPRAIERALLFGVGDVMPSYAESLPDRPARRALVSFVLSLDRSRPGGPPGR